MWAEADARWDLAGSEDFLTWGTVVTMVADMRPRLMLSCGVKGNCPTILTAADPSR